MWQKRRYLSTLHSHLSGEVVKTSLVLSLITLLHVNFSPAGWGFADINAFIWVLKEFEQGPCLVSIY